MDDTVISEIGRQLGMATDQAGQFIETYLPQYASMKVVTDTVVLCMLLGLLVVLGMCWGIVFRTYRKKKSAAKWLSEYEGYETASIAIGIVLGVFAFIVIIITAILVPHIIGWSQFPEAMLIEKTLDVIGGAK